MARLLPEPIVGAFPPAVLKIARALKAVSGDALTVWMGLPLPSVADRPDFLAVYEGTSAFVIAVCAVTRAELDEALNGSLFSSEKPVADSAALGMEERTRVRQFIKTALRLESSDEVCPPAVYGWILFPNVSHATLETVFPANPSNGCYWLGQEYCAPESLALCFQKLNTGMLEERQLALLRSHFTPETVVPPSFSARRRIQRQVAAELAPLLLDFDQEAWAKNRLKLSPEAAAVAEAQVRYGQPSGDAALVTGVAGSGKSLVLLFRACTQARLDPQSRSLVLTHNRALRGELARRFGELGKPANVVWHTFFSWVSESLGGANVGPRIVQYRERDEMIADAARAGGETVTASWVEFLRDEFDWMQDRDVTSLDEYRTIDRIGRRVRLNAEQRVRVHRVYCQYRDALERAHAEDWSGRALRFWRQVERGTLQLRTFNYIYIDEAQFFAPVWLRVLQHALVPDGRLLLAADPTQGFLKRRQSWTACGLDLRGRSTRLRRSYRNCREILEFARNFYRSRLAEDDDTDINLPEETELATAVSGTAPQVVQLPSRQDELTRVANEVTEYLQRGGDPDTLLVLIATSQRLNAVREALTARVGPDRIVDAKETASPGKIRLCSLDAATGLEAPVVFLVGAAELLEREGDLQLTTEQREELTRDNTRRLYMAFTRAGLRLVITWIGEVPQDLQKSSVKSTELGLRS